ncbi:MAG: glutamine--fructose-6-phosphate transaminase (isomerizing) [Sphingobacteriales bacterium]|jgi:glucosamine--fructose-6-phosphate aminotransferase (isomerizing)|nr:glutamine--fructose-6-phosphate transaminase (isomerizing) [Sphingobacteriales bacterium]MBP9140277.1 glutamine--fructose-6-phosphate transaminase (isomerizing) [Chitinophagales bacterium]MDA0197196.1 glutamine--fructose-6-phosphate transaminase (isomerizing) [Bacteroidota bacterium]MBK6891441.1 glutamine--fructose-6-phosphate transaminase (isomerizing) [Sphingobacteriales bacterium]MBK7526727.1 glutamine--fructose-6-phosphate transaminase (isomerizing) [Sphingobacteriales bacterium]
MCGIIAYIGPKQAYPIIINGLRRLEYRGYDSAGVALLNGSLQIYKRQGKVQDLDNYAAPLAPHGQVGIGHTRWATHGAPNNINAHPHVSRSGKIAVIHNGIIENYAVLKEELIKRGYQFHSDTDTEAIPHLIEEVQNRLPGVPLEDAMRIALRFVEGAYAFVVISEDEPHKLVAARKSSPLVIGIGKNEEEFFIASDGVPIIEHTRNVVYLDDYEVAVINMDADKKLAIKNAKENQPKEPFVHELTWNLETLEKGGYEHFMLKEIHEQPNSVAESMRGRLNALDGIIKIGGIENYEQKLINARRIIIVACGTSFYAGLVGEYLIEDLARIPVEVEYASEFRYRNPVIFEDDVVMAISQSGETADTLAAIQLAKSKGATILGICNVVGSSISRETDAGAYTHAGPEIGVASTKAFTAQLTILTLMALRLAHQRGTLTETRYRELLAELEQIPAKIKKTLETEHQIECIADLFKNVRNFLYLGRGYNYPVALEGALKLKEISYIHAEGYPAAEMKHGPIALIDENMPVVVLATNKSAYDKIISNIQQVKARNGRIIAITNENDELLHDLADYVIEIPDVAEPLAPLVSVIPLQLLAYHIAVMRGSNVDQPRNLAKSVTVE